MRKLVLGFMMLLMLTPILVCVMTFCPINVAQAAEIKPCHESETSEKQTNQSGPMFALDCMGVNLYQKDLNVDIAQHVNTLSNDLVWIDWVLEDGFFLGDVNSVRGPPPKIGLALKNNHDLYLTTQRLRI